MSVNTILSLFNGEYTFSVRSTSNNLKYKENLEKYITIEDNLQKLVDDEKFF